MKSNRSSEVARPNWKQLRVERGPRMPLSQSQLDDYTRGYDPRKVRLDSVGWYDPPGRHPTESDPPPRSSPEELRKNYPVNPFHMGDYLQTEEFTQHVLKLYGDGCPIKAIAAALGVSRTPVQRVLSSANPTKN